MLLEATVLHQFGIEATVAGVTDFLEKDTIEIRRHHGTFLAEVNADGLRLGHRAKASSRQCDCQECFFHKYIKWFYRLST